MRKYLLSLSIIIFSLIFIFLPRVETFAQFPSFELYQKNGTAYPTVTSLVVHQYTKYIVITAHAYDVSGISSLVASIEDPNNAGKYMNIEHSEVGDGIMYDDGAHSDGAAGDGVFGTIFNVTGSEWNLGTTYKIDISATDNLLNNSLIESSGKDYINIGSFSFSPPATPILTSVTVSPTSASLSVGGTQQLTASPMDQSGAPFSSATLGYASSDTSVATVSSSGLVTAVAVGTATITATATSGPVNVTATSAMIVSTMPPVLTSVTVAPTTATLKVGATQQLTASPLDQNGIALLGATLGYASSDTSVAKVSSSGLVTAVAVGTATITATATSGPVNVTATSAIMVNSGITLPTPTSLGVSTSTSTTSPGNIIKITATLTNSDTSAPIQGEPINFYDLASTNPLSPICDKYNGCGSINTGSDGMAIINYLMPSSDPTGNITFKAVFAGDTNILLTPSSNTVSVSNVNNAVVYIATSFLYDSPRGKVTLKGTLKKQDGTPISGETLTFIDDTDSSNPITIDSVVTAGTTSPNPGMATIDYTIPYAELFNKSDPNVLFQVQYAGNSGKNFTSTSANLSVFSPTVTKLVNYGVSAGPGFDQFTLNAGLEYVSDNMPLASVPIYFYDLTETDTGCSLMPAFIGVANTDISGNATITYNVPFYKREDCPQFYDDWYNYLNNNNFGILYGGNFLDVIPGATVIDTNNTATGSGQISSLGYYAYNTNPFNFVVVDSSNTVKYVSPQITPASAGAHTYVPSSPVSVDAGDNVGAYFTGTGTITYKSDPSLYSTDPAGYNTWSTALWTGGGGTLPTVGTTPDFSSGGSEQRGYSISINGSAGGSNLLAQPTGTGWCSGVDDPNVCYFSNPGSTAMGSFTTPSNYVSPGDTITLSAQLIYPGHSTQNGLPIAGQTLSFSDVTNGTAVPLGSGVTDSNGMATYNYTVPPDFSNYMNIQVDYNGASSLSSCPTAWKQGGVCPPAGWSKANLWIYPQ